MPELSRQSGKANINIEHGVDYKLTAIYKINGTVEDITGYEAAFTLRDHAGSTETLLELTHSAGITITGSLGKVYVVITAAQSVFGSREMVYDLTITSPTGAVVNLLRGSCQSWAEGEE